MNILQYKPVNVAATSHSGNHDSYPHMDHIQEQLISEDKLDQ